jgi:amidase
VAERDLNVVGPMARSARDLRLLLSVIEEGPLASKAPAAQLEGLKIGLWIEEPGFPLDPEVRTTVQKFVDELGRCGCQVESIRPGDTAALLAAYRLLLSSVLAEDMPPAMLANMRRMRGFARLASGLGEGARNWASLVLAYTASHAEWIEANEARERFALHLRGVLERHDAILAPITPVTAFPHDHVPFAGRKLTQSDGKTIPYTSMLNWISIATACGLPATAFPAGPAASGRPVGVQIIGPRGGDARVLSIAQAIEDRLGGFIAPPPL